MSVLGRWQRINICSTEGLLMTKASDVSYPKRKHIRLPPDAYHRTSTWYFVMICCRDKRSHFRAKPARNLVQDLLRRTAEENNVELAVYTIMPNHMHIICSAGRRGLIGFVRLFKGRTTAEFRRRFQKPSPWQARFFDHKIRNHESLRQKCEYVWMNPVRRGLARNPQDYPWSGQLLTGQENSG